MGQLSVQHRDGGDAFASQLDRFVGVCGGLSDRDLLARSRCWGWAVLDVVVHVRTGLQEMAGSMLTAAGDPVDTDAASYWEAPLPKGDPSADDVDAVQWTRRTAAAYRRPAGAVAHLRDVADAVAAAARERPDGPVRFQGHVMSSGDFLATWAVELAVHHLDIMVDLAVDPPTVPALYLARRTVEALTDDSLPAELDDVDAVLLGTGRRPPSPSEAELLGGTAERLPVLS